MPFGYGGGPWWAYGQYRNPYQRWNCTRYPWLPRGWWLDTSDYNNGLSSEEEKRMLNEDLNALKEDIKIIEERIRELEKSPKGEK